MPRNLPPHRNPSLRVLVLLLLVQSCLVFSADAPLDPGAKLVSALSPLIDVITEKTEHYTLRAEFDVGGKAGIVEFGRVGAGDFWLHIKAGKDIDGALSVTPAEVRLDIAPKNVAFVGTGALGTGDEAIQPKKLLLQSTKLNSAAQVLLSALETGDRETLGNAVSALSSMKLIANIEATESNGESVFKILVDKKKGTSLRFTTKSQGNTWTGELRTSGGAKDLQAVDNVIKLSISPKVESLELIQGRTAIAVPRAEIERSLQRGGMRALEILADDMHATAPADSVVNIPGARLEVANGQRVCYLTGTPAEMGRAHGKLLAPEIRRCTDSTLYVVGMYYSIGKGQWFLNEIRDAWKRLEPNVDKEYLEEMDGVAEGAGISKEEGRISNVFPELFHCSGFAIANEATVGGKLFHGRVLDYMTEIGLQHAQVDFVTRGPNRHATVNVGYAGFVGSVTGMSDAQISMGEMGGHGEGKWDGTPMAFLVRRVLEHSNTLEDARKILETAKRTCEYYYVIADGKTRTAYGVAAWPEKIDFLKQGQSHELLPNAMPGCVLLSAGDRYKLLTERAKDGLGKIDEAAAIELMRRPVSMTSNLHSVLFVPEDQIYHAAHASLRHHMPASETKYVRHDFKAQVRVLDELEKK